MCSQTKLLVFALALLLITSCTKSVQYFQENSHNQKTNEVKNAVNINTASIEELVKLPHIGEKTAAKIVEHREKFGKFRKPEHLLLIERISDARFREMKSLIKTE